jgi:hypothetical protein
VRLFYNEAHDNLRSHVVAMPVVKKSCRHWFRFSLRTLLITWLILAAWLAWWISSSKQQHDAVKKIAAIADRPGIYYSHQLLPTSEPSSTRIIGDEAIRSWAPDFVFDRLGIDYFHHVGSVIILESQSGEDVELCHQLAQLSKLQHLAIVYADLTDEAIESLGSLQSLTTLELNLLSQTDNSLQIIGSLSKLEALEISGNFPESGLIELKRLPNLKSLTIKSPRLTNAGIAHISEINTLGRLLISSSQITDDSFQSLKQLTNLHELYFDASQITGKGCGELANCTQLTSLSFYHTSFNDESCIDLSKLTSLETLELTGSKNFSGQGLKHLSAMKQLRAIGLAASEVKDGSIALLSQLPALEEIDLSYTNVTANSLESLATAPRLRSLVVPEKSLSFLGIGTKAGLDARELKRLQLLLPSCKVYSH